MPTQQRAKHRDRMREKRKNDPASYARELEQQRKHYHTSAKRRDGKFQSGARWANENRGRKNEIARESRARRQARGVAELQEILAELNL